MNLGYRLLAYLYDCQPILSKQENLAHVFSSYACPECFGTIRVQWERLKIMKKELRAICLSCKQLYLIVEEDHPLVKEYEDSCSLTTIHQS
jgi:hypothetical protein